MSFQFHSKNKAERRETISKGQGAKKGEKRKDEEEGKIREPPSTTRPILLYVCLVTKYYPPSNPIAIIYRSPDR